MEAEASGGGGPAGPQIMMDAGAAQSAADALRRLAASINAGADVFGGRLQTVTDGWQGQFRDAFDSMASSYLTEAAALSGALSKLAANIATAVEEATIYNAAVTKAQAAHTPLPSRPSPLMGASS